ncbi:MAG: hypothetical protein HQL14_05020 [Candidatus Omnitrophica bacterium]|nr:hypothetical protein [Candidatus Omnitrophota bacterium]
MAQFIGHDQWFVRWVPQFYGYGYPVFNFYPPLFSILGTVLVKTGLTYVWALNLACFFIVLFSGFTMYFFSKELWGYEGGFLSGVAYMIAPYLMLDLYSRGAYPEATSFPFLPLILWAFLKLTKELKAHYLSIASLSIAGLFLSHNCITLVFCPIIFLYILVLHLFPYRQNRPTITSGIRRHWPFLASLTAFGLGIGLAAFFWLPAILEKNFVHIDKLVGGFLDYHNNFLSIQQLIYSPWPTKPGPYYSYEIGPMHCLLAITTLCMITKVTKDREFLRPQILFLFLISMTCIFLTLHSSLIIWEHLPILKFMSFPWRFLVIITCMVSTLAGGITLVSHPKHRPVLMILGVLALLLINASRSHPPYGSVKVNLKNVTASMVFTRLQPQDTGEYLPQWVKTIRYPIPSEKLEIITGEGQILNKNTVSDLHQTFTVGISTPSILCFNVFYFPGWNIKVDGHDVDIFKNNPFGLMFFSINPGVHEIKADFGPTPVRRAATIISIVCLILLIGLLFYKIPVDS